LLRFAVQLMALVNVVSSEDDSIASKYVCIRGSVSKTRCREQDQDCSVSMEAVESVFAAEAATELEQQGPRGWGKQSWSSSNLQQFTSGGAE
jgi:hypothetical protein